MNSLRQFDHDEGARLAGDAIKEKIKSDPTWDNQFLDRNPFKSRCKRTKPAPDGRLHSIKTNCHVAIEYKPPYSHLDEIGKGFTQCFDYIVDQNDKGEFLNQASILVKP